MVYEQQFRDGLSNILKDRGIKNVAVAEKSGIRPDYSWEGSFFMLTCFYIIYYTVWFCVFLSVLFLCVVKSVVKGKKKPSESLEFQGFYWSG